MPNEAIEGILDAAQDKILGSKTRIATTILSAVTGSLLGGYVGNKAWQGPSKTAVDERAMDIVTKILMDRKPAAEMSQVEALQHRDQVRTQSTEQVR